MIGRHGGRWRTLGSPTWTCRGRLVVNSQCVTPNEGLCMFEGVPLHLLNSLYI